MEEKKVTGYPENSSPPKLNGTLRNFMLHVPPEIENARGIILMGRLIKSLVFTTDICIIRNVNADAVLAVYPFTPQPAITRAVISAAEMPVIAGVGGGLTMGDRVKRLAENAEFQGAAAVVVNSPVPDDIVETAIKAIDIPVVVTVISDRDNIESRLKIGARCFNVSAASRTPEIVAKIRRICPEAAVIATGGPNPKSILETIEAGADAITWTPPSNGDVFKDIMNAYREGKPHP